MFKTNKSHRRKQLFGLENQLPEKMKKKLEQTLFPLFYEEVFCQIDEAVFAPLYSGKVSRPNCPVNMLVVDGGYAGEEMREQVQAKGVAFIETGLKGKASNYNSTAFDIDETRGILRCPMGKEPIRTWMKREKAHALFSHEDCKGCTDRDQCFAKKQKKGIHADRGLSGKEEPAAGD